MNKGIKREMKAKIDRPTPYTMRGVGVKYAKKSDLTSSIWIRDEAFKGKAPADYLHPLLSGKARNPKRAERLLRSKGMLGPNEFLVPGKRTKLNQYGNIPRGVINKALSNLGAQLNRHQNTKRNTRKKKGQQRYNYFWAGKKGRRIGGIYHEKNGYATPLLIAVQGSPDYRKRLDFHKTAARLTNKFIGIAISKAVRKAIKTAK